tara:strand:+ start:603 stop:1235 length:633 start_codon:yes stop_codon:yes gene_type:complete
MLFISIFLFGCASDKIVKTYKGKVLTEDAIAVLTAPENITLLSVNGSEVQQYLLSNLSVDYGLQAGENLVVFKYASIWSKATRDEESGSRVDVVESLPLEVLINAEPGAKYSFNFVSASNVREARAIASNFIAQVVDGNKNVITESVALNTHQKAKDKLVREQQALLLSKGAAVSDNDGLINTSVIERLKQLWPLANAEEKKAFLVWVFQ